MIKYIFTLLTFALSATQLIHGQVVVEGNAPIDIPDSGCPATVTSTATISSIHPDAIVSFDDNSTFPSYIIDTVRIDITHTFTADLEITLTSPDGVPLDLSSDNGGGGDNYTNTRIADGFPNITTGSAPFTGVFRAEADAFANRFLGEKIMGDWKLDICDDAGADLGTLNSYSISFSPTNDLCANATPLVMGTNHRGSNVGATINNLPNALRSCSDDSSEGGAGVWYVYTGTGTDVIASTEHSYTNFDTEILIYTGDCSNLVCLAGNDRGGAGNTSKAAFSAASGTDYYIYVDGADNQTVTGVFELSIEAAVANNFICGAIPATFVNDIDNECSTVTSLDFSSGTTKSGLATICDGSTHGRDQFFAYTTRTDTLLWDSRGAAGPGIVIWDESGTTELSCSMNFIDRKLYGWAAGDVIIIQIYDFITDFPTGAVIDFCIRDYLPILANDECEGATPLIPHDNLGCGTATPATLFGATQSNTGSATTSFYDERDVWFSFVATDTAHLVDISNSVIDFDLILDLCASHQPVATFTRSRNRVGGLTIGDTYLIRAYDDRSNTDPHDEVTFDICIGLLSPEDICSGAIMLPVEAICSPRLFTFEGAVRDDGECGDAGVWFEITVPSAGAVQITTSSPGTSTDTEISVYRGDCSNLTEIIDCRNEDNTEDQDHETVVVTGTSGETLYILVSDDGDDFGSFSICVEVSTAQILIPSDDCAGATFLEVSNSCEPTGLYTFLGATEGDDECSDNGVWFKVAVPPSGGFTFSTLFPGSNDDTEIKVYSGSCGSLTLLSDDCQDDDNTDFDNHEEFEVTGQTPGDNIYIVVDDRGDRGTFSVCVFDSSVEEPDGLPTSDDCAGAVLLQVDDTCEAKGPYTFADATNGTDECDYIGVWFKVAVPASGSVAFSTLFPGSNDDTEIKVYSGSCGSLTLLSDDCQDDDNTIYDNHELIILDNQTPDDTLYIVVDDRDEGGTFSVCVFDPYSGVTLASSDDCAGAILLDVDETCVAKGPYTFQDATNGPDECDYNGVWFKVAVPTSGSIIFSTLFSGSNATTDIKVYGGSCGSFTLLSQDCQDEDNTDIGEHEQIFIADQTPDDTLYIVVDDEGTRGTFSVCVYESNLNVATPADECVDATVLSVQPTCVPSYYTFLGATEGADEPCEDPGVWFKTVVPSSGSFTVTTLDLLGFDTGIELSIYSGSCGSLVPINQECQDDDNAEGQNERYTLTNRTPDEEIYILVTDDFEEHSVFGICLSESADNANCTQSELDVNLAQIAFYQDSTYKTTGTISSGVKIDQYQEFLFRAPQQIDLNLNFTVPVGIQFSAEIGPCE